MNLNAVDLFNRMPEWAQAVCTVSAAFVLGAGLIGSLLGWMERYHYFTANMPNMYDWPIDVFTGHLLFRLVTVCAILFVVFLISYLIRGR